MNIKKSITFFLEKRKKEGKVIIQNVPIIMRVTFNSARADFSTGYRIDADKWDLETQRVKKGCSNKKKETAADINAYLSSLETTMTDLFKSYEVEEMMPSVSMVRDDFNNRLTGEKIKPEDKPAKKFRDVWAEFSHDRGIERGWTKATYQKFAACLNHLLSFKSNISFEDMNEKTLNRWLEYLRALPMPDGTIGMKNSTIGKQLGYLRWFLNWATDKGYNTNMQYRTYHPLLKTADNEPIFITGEEIHALLDFNAPKGKEHLNVCRDIFIFCCFSSLRWSDVHNLKKSSIVNDCICITQQKTAKTVTIELNKYTRAILEKYQEVVLPNDAALPVVSNQKMNDALKVLFKMAGLDKPVTKTYFVGSERLDVTKPLYERISTHVGRKTFVVTGLSSGLSPYTITQWTGHSSLKAMKPYMAIADKVKKESMKKFDEV